MISIEHEIEVREQVLAGKAVLENEIEALKASVKEIEEKIVAKEAELEATDWVKVEQEIEFLKSILAKSTPVVEEPIVEEVVVEPEIEEVVEEPVVETPVVEEVSAIETPVETIAESVAPVAEPVPEVKVEAPKAPKIKDPFGTVINRINF